MTEIGKFDQLRARHACKIFDKRMVRLFRLKQSLPERAPPHLIALTPARLFRAGRNGNFFRTEPMAGGIVGILFRRKQLEVKRVLDPFGMGRQWTLAMLGEGGR